MLTFKKICDLSVTINIFITLMVTLLEKGEHTILLHIAWSLWIITTILSSCWAIFQILDYRKNKEILSTSKKDDTGNDIYMDIIMRERDVV